MKFSTRTRDIIRKRSNGRCELCGMPLNIYGQIHHRRPRGMGGTKRMDSASAANGLYVHQKCHEKIESNRAHALEMGWLMHQTDDPVQVPVRLWLGWRLLRDDGSIEMVSNAESSADTNGIKGANEIVPDTVGADQSDNGSLANTEFNSDQISGDSL